MVIIHLSTSLSLSCIIVLRSIAPCGNVYSFISFLKCFTSLKTGSMIWLFNMNVESRFSIFFINRLSLLRFRIYICGLFCTAFHLFVKFIPGLLCVVVCLFLLKFQNTLKNLEKPQQSKNATKQVLAFSTCATIFKVALISCTKTGIIT